MRGSHLYGFCDGCGERKRKLTLRGGEWHCSMCAVALVFVHCRGTVNGDVFELEADCPLERRCWSPVPWHVAEGLTA